MNKVFMAYSDYEAQLTLRSRGIGFAEGKRDIVEKLMLEDMVSILQSLAIDYATPEMLKSSWYTNLYFDPVTNEARLTFDKATTNRKGKNEE